MPSVKDTYHIIKRYSTVEKLQLLFILLFVATLNFNQRINSIFLGLSFISLLPTFQLAKLRQSKKDLLLFILPYLFAIVALFYSSNVQEGRAVLERQLALFLFPVFYLTSFRLNTVKFKLILHFFFITLVGISLYLMKHSFEQLVWGAAPLNEWLAGKHLNHAFSRPIGMHATYLSLFIAMGIFIGFNGFLFGDKWWARLLFFISTLLLSVTILLLSSRVVISAVLFILIFIYPFYIAGSKHKITLVIAGCVIVMAFLLIMRESSFMNRRFTEKIEAEINMTPFLQADSTYNPIYGGEMRADRWYCAAELIKERPVLGYGTGTEKDELMRKYEKYNLLNAIMHRYDAHNQYLAFAIKGGCLGLLTFLIALVYAFYLAISRKSLIYLAFLMLFTITCMTENVLESNKGIFFFAFFNTLLATKALLPDSQDEQS